MISRDDGAEHATRRPGRGHTAESVRGSEDVTIAIDRQWIMDQVQIIVTFSIVCIDNFVVIKLSNSSR